MNRKAEDVHHFVETALIEKLGPLGAKLHTGRSRNEMVATEFRMYVKDAAREMRAAIALLARRDCADQAERNLGRSDAGHDAYAARAAAAAFALAAGARRGISARCGAARCRRSDARMLARWVRARSAGCAFPLDREALARELGFSRDHGEQPRCRRRPRFRAGVSFRACGARDAPFAALPKTWFCSRRRNSAFSTCRTNIRPAAA